MVNITRRHSPLHKRWAAIVLVLILVFSSASALAAAEFAVIYNTNRLNLRKEPSSDSAWLGAYTPGTWIQVTSMPVCSSSQRMKAFVS